MKKLLSNLINHERYQSIAIIVCIGLLLIFYGCESQVASLVRPDQRVGRQEFINEVNQFLNLAEIRIANLDKQDAIRAKLFEIGLLTAQTGAFNPIGLITAMAGILGVGATVDNVRKRRDLKKWENGKLAPKNS